MGRVIDSQEKERQRLARDIHDDTIQALVATANFSEALESLDESNIEESKKIASKVRSTILYTVEELRRICVDLRPSILDNMGLISSLRWLVDLMNSRSNIHVQLEIMGEQHDLSPSSEIAVFRTIQEALSNIVSHSKATNASIVLKFGAQSLNITVCDNGQGFHQPMDFARLAKDNKLGLIGIRERITPLGGKIEVQSRIGEGTLLSVELKY